ncbi:extracellular solute-binding protein [Fodinicurvata halophila]|uniref:Extracellular solute-binding protein n=1 Tax=Fodinicurvata halophila TaxID=1419723 RepID=A0ABV8UQT8_9PROT
MKKQIATTGQRPGFTRRQVMKSAAAGAAVLAAPAIISPRALSSSGEVRVYCWAGYFSDDMLADFTDKTGIEVTRVEFGSNEEQMNQVRANQASGFDLIMPTIDRVPQYVEEGLLSPLNTNNIDFDQVIAGNLNGADEGGGMVGGERYVAPTDWGTEALSFNKDEAPLEYGSASYGDLWNPDYSGFVTLRGHSGLVGIGLWLQDEGRLPHSMRECFADEEKMAANYDIILEEAIKNKGSIAQFWNNENEAQGAFRTNGCVIGQTWDSTGARLWDEGMPIRYLAPKEGALMWIEGFGMLSGAENIEQAEAFINWYYTPEVGAMYANETKINTTVKGAEEHLDDFNREFFAYAYPEDALDKLWAWPVQDAWFISKRNEYAERFLAA